MTKDLAVEVNGISKIFSSGFPRKNVTALDDISLNVESKQIFGLLGQNGAGKTTLIKILMGTTLPSSGSFRVLNHELTARLRNKMGCLPENTKFPDHLKGREALKVFGKLSGLSGSYLSKRIDEMLELVQMKEAANRTVKTYSKGMQQRLGLAQALIHNPDLIFLDEPTDGMDPVGRKQVRDALLLLKEQGKTIFINSHILSEVEMITDRIAILNKGKIIKEGSVRNLTEKSEEYRIIIDSITDIQYNSFNVKISSYSRDGDNALRVTVKDILELNSFIDHLRSENILIQEIIPVKQSLEQVYLSFIQQAKGN